MGRDGCPCLKGLKMKDLKSRVTVLWFACARSSVYVSVNEMAVLTEGRKSIFCHWIGPSLSKGSAGRCCENAVLAAGLHSFFPLVSHSQNTYTTHAHARTRRTRTHTHTKSGTINFSVCLMAAYRRTQRKPLFWERCLRVGIFETSPVIAAVPSWNSCPTVNKGTLIFSTLALNENTHNVSSLILPGFFHCGRIHLVVLLWVEFNFINWWTRECY